MDKLIKYIEDTQQSIFKYNISKVSKNIENICNELDRLLLSFEDKDKKQLNNVLYYINISLSNEDYLLCADLLEYELKPFLNNNNNNILEGSATY